MLSRAGRLLHLFSVNRVSVRGPLFRSRPLSCLGSLPQPANPLCSRPPVRHFAPSAAPLSSRDRVSAGGWNDGPVAAAAAATMEVTRHNFEEVLPVVRAALAGAAFFAFDLEMSGLHVRDSRFSFHDTIQDQYEQMVESAQAFQITQFGLSAFRWEGGAYVARTFNFYIFPRPADGFDARFLCQAGSMDFLASQGFDFNNWVRNGIGYLPAALRDVRLAALRERRNGEDAAGDGVQRDPIPLTKQEDVAFTQRLQASVDAWLQGEEPTLLLEPANAYYRRLQYQHLGSRGTPAKAGFVVERLPNGRQAVLQLRRQTSEQAAEWQEAQLREKEAAIHRTAGFTAVLQAMRDSGVPAVGHNLALDLAFTLQAFVGPLPPSWREYKVLAAAWFPGGIYDTKRLAAQLPEVFQGQTSLGEVYDIICGRTVEARTPERQPSVSLEAADIDLTTLPRVQHADGFLLYSGEDEGSFAHEAGYDAYMTAASFAVLLRLLEMRPPADGGSSAGAPDATQAPSLEAAQQFAGQLNLVRTDIPYAALVGDDPQPDRRHVFHISGLPPGSRHSDISTAFALAGIGRIQSVMLDANGTTAMVAVVNLEAADNVVAALADWEPRVTPFADWARRQCATGDAEMTDAEPSAAAAAIESPLRNGHARIKRRRVMAEACAHDAHAQQQPAQRTSCAIQ